MAYKEMHTLYEAEQTRANRLSRDEAAKELGNEENSGWVTEQLKKALDPKDRDTAGVLGAVLILKLLGHELVLNPLSGFTIIPRQRLSLHRPFLGGGDCGQSEV